MDRHEVDVLTADCILDVAASFFTAGGAVKLVDGGVERV